MLGMRRRLPLKPDINLAILKLRERGLLKKILKRTQNWSKAPDCSKTDDHNQSAYTEVGFNHVYVAFAVMVGGWALAAVTGLLEWRLRR